LRQLDYKAAGVGAVIWATGYAFDFGWIKVPALNADGEPRHHLGLAPVAGLYFLGLPWLSKMNSSFLTGVADDAARLADQIRSRTPVAANA
jgi:putative flavoprotein involved in K+ transport